MLLGCWRRRSIVSGEGFSLSVKTGAAGLRKNTQTCQGVFNLPEGVGLQ